MKSADPRYWDFYKRYRRKMQEFSMTQSARKYGFTDILMLGPDLLHLCIHLMIDPEVPIKHKAKIAFSITYFISPLDLMPEIIFGPFGFLDDIGIVAFVLNGMINEIPEHVLQRHWAGDRDLITIIRGIIQAMDRMFGSGLLERIKRMASGSEKPKFMKDAAPGAGMSVE